MTALPSLFVSHGAPTFALEPGAIGSELAELARSLPKPDAVVIVSPHWTRRTTMVTTTAQPATIHDFGGFPEALYRLSYPAPGAPAVATRAIGLLEHAGVEALAEPRRGLDHGAWVPLMHMYPDATVPVVQVSLQPDRPPRDHYELGRALAPLRDEGVLIVGSGSITHNLYEFRGPQQEVSPYVTEFTGWIADRLAAWDLDALLDYRRRAPQAARAHPTDEHLMPLMFALGAAGERPVMQRLGQHDVRYGMLAMDAYVFGS